MHIVIISISKIEDTRGNLSVLENEILTFEFKRVYYLYDIPSVAARGGYSHIKQTEFLNCIK